MKEKYIIGDVVRLCADKSRVGMISMILTPVGSTNRFQVFHSPMDIGEYYENQIELSVTTEKNTQYSPKRFSAVLNAKKFCLNSDDTIFSVNTGRIKFIPFQFRPLSKILKADKPRLLIADEVGVGKTIEAGIIIKEFEKRESIKKILIICPKDLTLKWQREMRERFDEHFDVLNSDRLKYCFTEMEREGVWPYECKKSIIGIELLRREENLNRLIGFADPTDFDMVIVDEAHHVINQTGKAHQMVEYFCEHSEIALFLSATPLQLGSNDLFSLLNMLDPSEFLDSKTFNQMIEPNKFINMAVRHIRNTSNLDWQEKAFESLGQVFVNDWANSAFQNNYKLQYWIKRLSETESLSNEDRIDCLRDLENLHTLSHLINRTKRKDIGSFTIREPITVMTEFSSEEKVFYDEVKDFKSTILTIKYNPIVTNLIMSTIERQLTSCIPAFKRLLDQFLRRGILSLSDFSDDIDTEEGNINVSEFPQLLEQMKKIKVLANNLPEFDSKTKCLLKIIHDSIDNTPDGKLLVFSFFKHTLKYLLEQITNEGVRVALITGDTSVEERESLRNRFRLSKQDDKAIDVLLCSEVGCEGLDYEFCSRMVNYDIPWNPMKIEQRIGRIDRFGQKSEKIQIYNFITSGTVEERVFFRCFERLGIFNSTLGDLEEVLGEIVTELTQTAFDITLSGSQLERKTTQIADNILRLASETREFEKNSKELFLMDLKNEDNVIQTGKEIQARITKNILMMYFSECYPNVVLVEDPKNSNLKVKIYKEDKQTLQAAISLMKKSKKIEKNTTTVKTLDAFLANESQSVNLIFEHFEDLVYENCMLITVDHPLLKIATEYFNQVNNVVESSFKTETIALDKGAYAFACYEWSEIGYRENKEIKTVIYNFKEDKTEVINNILFDDLVLLGTVIDTVEHNILASVEKLNQQIFEERGEKKVRLHNANIDIITRKLSTLDSYYAGLLDRIRYEINTAKNPKIKIMKDAQMAKSKVLWQERKVELNKKLESDITVKLIAQGFMEVV